LRFFIQRAGDRKGRAKDIFYFDTIETVARILAELRELFAKKILEFAGATQARKEHQAYFEMST
jgi:hypothetical protein